MTRQKKNKVRVESVPWKENVNEIRNHRIESLEKSGIRVFMTKEEGEKEPDECKIEWGNGCPKRVLTRGPAFSFTAPKLSDDEKEIAINRTVASMAVKIRTNLIESRAGRKRTQAQAWEVDKGLRMDAHKWHITPQPKTLQEMKATLLVEIGRGFEVEMRNEAPEFDEGGRKRIKQRKLGLKDTGVQLIDFRDTWVAIEDQRVEMRQRSDSEDKSDMEEEGEVHRKRKRQGSNRKGKQ